MDNSTQDKKPQKLYKLIYKPKLEIGGKYFKSIFLFFSETSIDIDRIIIHLIFIITFLYSLLKYLIVLILTNNNNTIYINLINKTSKRNASKKASI